MMEIIKCKCGYYKQLNDELCPKCGADYSTGDEYEILDDQETAYMRWMNLGEKGFNEYMESASQPHYMICPVCRFKMLITETRCPKCNTPVKYKLPSSKTPFIVKAALFASGVQILWVLLPALFVFIAAIVFCFIR